tara:strand:- start:783 stop:1064 length:282 start_codon:yes stop_codon:yes gene_type:complete
MISLYGIKEEAEYGYGGWTGNSETVRKLVATFDELQDAKEYVANSTLKAANDPYFYADPISGKFKYRKGSLLRYYESCEIEEEEIPAPHNPEL